MICKRCGASCEEKDRFCRDCGKRLYAHKVSLLKNPPEETTLAESAEAPTPSNVKRPLSSKKKLAFFICFGILLLITAFVLIFLPYLKQAFMSPAAYYLDCESNEIKSLSNALGELADVLYTPHAQTVNAQVQFEVQGDEYQEIAPLLEDLQLSANYKTNAKDRTALSIDAAYDGDVFCRILGNVVGEELSVKFPDMTKGEITAKFASVLQNSLKGSEDACLAVTGYSRKELASRCAAFLRPLLLNVLNESEQTLDITVIDGLEVSTVTFTLSEKQAKQIVRDFSAALRADEIFPSILKNTANFFTASEEFKRDFIAEFHLSELSEEDLSSIPFFVSLLKNPGISEPHNNSLTALLFSTPEETAISEFIDTLADSLLTNADNLSLPDGISLTAYYQKTQLIGRTLKRGNAVLFECFHYRRSNESIFELSLSHGGNLYHFSHIDTSNNTEGNHVFSLSRLPADIDAESETSQSTTEEILFTLDVGFEKNATVSGVPVFLGEATLTVGDDVYSLIHSMRTDNSTHLHLEKKTLSEGSVISRFIARADLEFSASVNADEIQISGTSNFGRGEFKEFILNLKCKLQDSELFETFFGEGSLDRFKAEEEKRLQEAGDEFLTQNNQTDPESQQG